MTENKKIASQNTSSVNNSKRESIYTKFKNAQKVTRDKCLLPNETISWVRREFRNFFDHLGFKIAHSTFESPFDDIWSTLTFITRNKQRFLIVGGKGTSLETAVASGYGELMERLQAGYFFSSNPYRLTLSQRFESHILEKTRETNRHFRNRAKLNNPYLPIYKKDREQFVTCINVETKESALIEHHFLLEGTGCCAGNSYEEAFVQGACEIFERYAAIKTVLEKIRCPTIPKERLSAYNQEVIQQFENAGIQVHVKDFSLNQNLPVVGILFCYDEFQEKELKIGSAPSIDVAVERCLTECMQIWALSLMKKQFYSTKLSEILAVHVSRIRDHFKLARNLYNTFPHLEKYLPFRYFITIRFPRHYFYPKDELEFLTENHGVFKEWNYYNEDCLEEVQVLLKLCAENDCHAFVQDCNWLGFPALKVFIPELYLGCNEYIGYSTPEMETFKKKILFKFDSIRAQDLTILTDPAFLIHACYNNSFFKFFKIQAKTYENLSVWKFFGLLAVALGERKLAKLYLNQLVANKFNLTKSDVDLLHNQEKIIPYLKKMLPNCVNSCHDCKFQTECRYPQLEAVEKEIAVRFPRLFVLKQAV